MAKLEKLTDDVASPPKTKRKPPTERKALAAKGLRGRTK